VPSQRRAETWRRHGEAGASFSVQRSPPGYEIAFIFSNVSGTSGSLPSIGHFSVRVLLQSVFCWLTKTNCAGRAHSASAAAGRRERKANAKAKGSRLQQMSSTHRQVILSGRDFVDHGELSRVILAVLAVAERRHRGRGLRDQAEDAHVEVVILRRVVGTGLHLDALLGDARCAGTGTQRTTGTALAQCLWAGDLLVALHLKRDRLNVGTDLRRQQREQPYGVSKVVGNTKLCAVRATGKMVLVP
jgi:hypothetical protein